MKRGNLVAKIMSYYAVINTAAGFILMFSIARNFDWSAALMLFGVALVASFFIYAFAEVIELLAEIRNNTSSSVVVTEKEELPDI